MSITQSCLTVCDPMDCSPPGSSVHGILQQEYWNGLPFPSTRDLSRPRDQTWVSCRASRFFTIWATRRSHTTHIKHDLHSWRLHQESESVPPPPPNSMALLSLVPTSWLSSVMSLYGFSSLSFHLEGFSFMLGPLSVSFFYNHTFTLIYNGRASCK